MTYTEQVKTFFFLQTFLAALYPFVPVILLGLPTDVQTEYSIQGVIFLPGKDTYMTCSFCDEFTVSERFNSHENLPFLLIDCRVIICNIHWICDLAHVTYCQTLLLMS